MLKCKIINPKWFIIILILFLSIIIFNNNIERTFCEEEYQIAECPNNLYLSSYYITAENNASAISAVENILLNNNFNLDDYEIIVENNIIKIIEKEKQETIEKEKAETEKQEIEEIKKAETEETTTIYVEVISEDKKSNVVYTYILKRDVTGNNNLESITITNPDIEIENFNPYTYEYYITLPTGFAIDIEAVPERKENTKLETNVALC